MFDVVNIETQQQDSTTNSLLKPKTDFDNINQDTSNNFNFFEAKDQSIIQIDSNNNSQTNYTNKTQLQKEYAYYPKKKKYIETDTLPKNIYNVDTIPYLLVNNTSDIMLQENFLLNLKSIKPNDTKKTHTDINFVNFEKNKQYKKSDESTINNKSGYSKIFYSGYKYNSNTNWEIGVILFVVIIFGWIRLMYKNVISNFTKAVGNYQVAYKTFIDSNILTKQASVFLDILFFISVSLLLFQIFEYNNIGVFKLVDFKVYLLCLTFLLSVYIVKAIVHIALGYLFLIQKEMREYIFQIFLYNKMAGVIIIPFIASYPFIPIEFRPIVLYSAAIILILIYIIRIFRGILISFKKRLSVFYIILYLCTLEILPIIVFYKLYAS